MSIRGIVLHLAKCKGQGGDPGVEYALGLARAHSCAVTAVALAIVPDPITEPDDRQPGRAPDVSGAAETQVMEAFAAAAEAAQVPCETMVEPSYGFSIGEVFADYARVRDLAVMGVGDRISRRELLLAQVALFESGRPLVLVPEGVSMFRQDRLVVAWDASPSAVHAITGAMPFLEAAREIVVFSVVDDKPFRPGQSGVELCRHLARHRVQATFEAIERGNREVADVIRQTAQAHSADILVMGAYAHSTLRGLIFGSATHGILAAPIPVPVLMAH